MLDDNGGQSVSGLSFFLSFFLDFNFHVLFIRTQISQGLRLFLKVKAHLTFLPLLFATLTASAGHPPALSCPGKQLLKYSFNKK